MAASLQALFGFVGKGIGDICPNSFSARTQNHCAHFVSHAHGMAFGVLCGDMTFATRRTGATIRCDELYNALPRRGAWSSLRTVEDGTLVFAISARNMAGDHMRNVPQKHVGIYCAGQVFNFSNSQGKVIADPSLEAFHQKFKRAYAGNDITLYCGTI